MMWDPGMETVDSAPRKRQRKAKATPVEDELLVYSERQFEHLREIAKDVAVFQGPCRTCRWARDNGERCANPTIITGKMDTRTGKVSWRDEATSYVRGLESWRSGNSWDRNRRTLYPVCGPSGKLWEPRTYGQITLIALLWMPPVTFGYIFAAFFLTSLFEALNLTN